MSSLISEHTVKLDRKSLGKPDSFTSYFKKLFEDLQKHRGTQVSVVLAVLGLAALVGWWSNHHSSVNIEGMDELFTARDQADKELTAFAATVQVPAPPAPKADPKKPDAAKKPDAKTPPPAPTTLSPELARFSPLDVDSKFPQALAAFKKVISAHPGTLAATQANLAIADLYYDHGAAERSTEYYRAALNLNPPQFYKMLSGYSLASALYELGKFDEALAAIDGAQKTGAKEMRGELLLLQGRVLEKKKDNAGAKKVYEQIEKDFANSPTAQTATHRKALL